MLINPLACLKLYVKNVQPVEPRQINFSNTSFLRLYDFQYEQLHTIVYGQTVGNVKATISYTVGTHRSPIYPVYNRATTFFLPRFDTTAIEILY